MNKLIFNGRGYPIRAIHTREVQRAGIIAAVLPIRLLQGGLRQFNLSGQGGDE